MKQSKEHMKKLEEIPKKNPFEVPAGYFDRLPGIIQARVAQNSPESNWLPFRRMAFRYALPVVALLGIGIFWFTKENAPVNVTSELAAIRPEQLAVYLDNHELSTEDLVEKLSWSPDDLDELEDAVYSNSTLQVPQEQLQSILNEYDEL